tara:strand:- start:145 stop:279 length:135 start_codon:yes stop_codon:yes gene_type:complete
MVELSNAEARELAGLLTYISPRSPDMAALIEAWVLRLAQDLPGR